MLDDGERAALVLAMFRDVLAALRGCADVERIVVVSPDRALADEIEVSDATWIGDDIRADEQSAESSSLNAVLLKVQQLAARAGARRMLIVPADLPLLSASDVGALLRAASGALGEAQRPRIVIAPDGADTGTNALLLQPPDALAPSFGTDSFHAHLAWAAELGLGCEIVRRPNLLLDIDTADDLVRFLQVAPEGNTLDVLRSLRIERRVRRPRGTGVGGRGGDGAFP